MRRSPITRRLALASARRPRLTVALWAAALVAAAILVSQYIDVLKVSDDFVGRPESKRAEALIAERLPGAGNDIEIVVVRSTRRTVDDPVFRDFVGDLAGRLGALAPAHVAGVRSYLDATTPEEAALLVSQDRHTTILPVRLPGALSDAEPHLDRIVPVVDEAARQAGFTVVLTGSAAWEREATAVGGSDLVRGERIGLPIALLILVLVFGALVAAGLPLVLAAIAIVVALALTALTGQALSMSVFAVNVITMMGLAVGIDYSLFIVARFREELRGEGDVVEAVGRTAATASRAVLFSGLTVVLALAGLLLVPFSVFTSMGIGSILVVVAAVAAALTLLPAALALLGRRVDALRLPRWLHRPNGGSRTGFWEKTARLVMAHRVCALLLGGGVLVLLAAPALLMDNRVIGVAGTPERLGTHRGYDILARDFSAGLTSPILVAVDGRVADPRVASAVERLRQAAAADGRFAVTGLEVSQDGDFALLQLATDVEASSDDAAAAVHDLRRRLVPQAFHGAPATVLVGGAPALFADMMVIIDRFTPVVLATVLGLSFCLLLLAFRSLVVALKAVLMNLLSVGAAYGLLVLVFQKGWGAGLLGFQQVDQIESFVPLLLFCILFGLSMDYQVFLLSRIRERYDACGDTREAVAFGLSSTAGIITGAALIMVAVFAGLASGEMVMFQQIGFGLAVAIALDATLVRTVVVPASMALLGDWNWYLPRRLEWLPRVTLEEGAGAGAGAVVGRQAEDPAGPRREGDAGDGAHLAAVLAEVLDLDGEVVSACTRMRGPCAARRTDAADGVTQLPGLGHGERGETVPGVYSSPLSMRRERRGPACSTVRPIRRATTEARCGSGPGSAIANRQRDSSPVVPSEYRFLVSRR